MAIDAKGLVLMRSENGILSTELGSYEINEGLDLVYKAYVIEDLVKLFVTTENDVTDEEYNEIFDEYDSEKLIEEGFEIEEVEDEYNPVWCISLKYSEDHDDMEEDLNYVISYHIRELKRVLSEIKS